MAIEWVSPLKAFRDARDGMSQADAANLFGITQAHWSRLENGEAHASPKLAQRIARLTGVSADWLMGLVDNGPAIEMPAAADAAGEIAKD